MSAKCCGRSGARNPRNFPLLIMREREKRKERNDILFAIASILCTYIVLK